MVVWRLAVKRDQALGHLVGSADEEVLPAEALRSGWAGRRLVAACRVAGDRPLEVGDGRGGLVPRPVGVLVDVDDPGRHEWEIALVLAAVGEHLLEQPVPLGEVPGSHAVDQKPVGDPHSAVDACSETAPT